MTCTYMCVFIVLFGFVFRTLFALGAAMTFLNRTRIHAAICDALRFAILYHFTTTFTC